MEKNNKNKTAKEKIKKGNNKKTEDIRTDVLGSYTGVPENRYDTPVQDADDL